MVNSLLILLGTILIFVTLSPLKDVGVTLLASGIVGTFSVYIVKVQQSLREGAERLQDWGLIDIFPDRSNRSLYDQFLQRCKERLDIQAETLGRFYEDFKDLLPELDRRGVGIRLLLLDPRSEQCQMRKHEEESSERANLDQAIKEQTSKYINLNLKHMEIRWYSCTPSVNYFRVDDHVFFGSYFVGTVSRNSLTFFSHSSSRVVEPYTSHFQKVWSKFSVPVDMKSLETSTR